MKAPNYRNTRSIVIGGFVLIALVVIGVALLGYSNMKSIRDIVTTMFSDRLVPIHQVDIAEAELEKIWGNLFQVIFLPEQNGVLKQEITASVTEINKLMEAYQMTVLEEEEYETLPRFKSSWMTFQLEIDKILALAKSGDKEAALQRMSANGSALEARNATAASLNNLGDFNLAFAAMLDLEADATSARSAIILAVVGLAGALFALGLGIRISAIIAKQKLGDDFVI